MKIRATEVRLVPINEVKPHPQNRNKHPQEQIDRLAEIIQYQGFRNPLVISNQSGLLVQGHGRLLAAQKLGLEKVPVIYQDFESPEMEYAAQVSDNAVASWAELDLAGINADLAELGPDFDIDLLGIEGFTLDVAEKGDGNEDSPYTTKIEAPIYEPKGICPAVSDLYDESKAIKMAKQIEELDAPPDVKEFLKVAAQRHTVFNYEKIAEFYAHAPVEVQDLMERSALVIIDFNKAIENGFVVMTKEIAEAYPDGDE